MPAILDADGFSKSKTEPHFTLPFNDSTVEVANSSLKVKNVKLMSSTYISSLDSEAFTPFLINKRVGDIFSCPLELALIYCICQDCQMCPRIAKKVKSRF